MYGSSDSFRSAGGRSTSSRKSYRSSASSFDPSMDVRPSSGDSVSDSSRRSRGGGSVHSARSGRSQSSRTSARSSGRTGGDGPGTPRPAPPRGPSASFSYSPRKPPSSPGGGGGGGGGASVYSTRSAPPQLSRGGMSRRSSTGSSRLGSLDEDRVDTPGEYFGGDYNAPLDHGSVHGSSLSGASVSSRQSGRGGRQTSMRSAGSDMIDLRSVKSNRSGVSRQGSARSVGSRESYSTPQASVSPFHEK